jgi:Ca2+-binding RTX toxin-like protein
MAIFKDVILTLGTAFDDQIGGTDGDDDLRGSQGNDFIFAGNGNDFLRGGAGDDKLYGNKGNDRLEGAAGNDSLFGGQGTDVMYGGGGRDIMAGELGTDTLFGGTGDDVFYFTKSTAGIDGAGGSAFDTIRDFAVGDTIVFGNYGSASKLMFTVDGTNINILIDLNGDGTAEYLAATVANANLADVQAATSFGTLIL